LKENQKLKKAYPEASQIASVDDPSGLILNPSLIPSHIRTREILEDEMKTKEKRELIT
jgi:hypothetical protein